jgi:pimeloyl-ACP methyl ester carboxylesterase
MYSWRNIIDSLSLNHTVYAFDMPGHGYTVAKDEPEYNLDDFASFIDLFVTHFKIDKINIIGNSWGGGWALYYAEKFPDKVKKLILIDPSGLDVKDVFEWEILKYPLLGELASKMVTKNAVRKAYEKVYVNQSFVDSVLIEETYKPLQIKQNQRATYKIKRHCDWKITERQMGNLTIPVQIIWGDKDNYLNVKYAEIYAAKIKTSDLTISVSRRANSESVSLTRFRASNFSRKLRSSAARSRMSRRYSYFRPWSVPMKSNSMASSRTAEGVASASG